VTAGSQSNRRTLALGTASVELLLAAMTVLGMATGTRQQFDKGVAPRSVVILVQVLGALTLVLLAVGVRMCVQEWQGPRSRFIRWFLIAAAGWLVWAFVRVGEYAS
jgi:hypothetical protein